MWSTLGGLRRGALVTLDADGGCRDSNSEECGGMSSPARAGRWRFECGIYWPGRVCAAYGRALGGRAGRGGGLGMFADGCDVVRFCACGARACRVG